MKPLIFSITMVSSCHSTCLLLFLFLCLSILSSVHIVQIFYALGNMNLSHFPPFPRATSRHPLLPNQDILKYVLKRCWQCPLLSLLFPHPLTIFIFIVIIRFYALHVMYILKTLTVFPIMGTTNSVL